MSSVSIEDVRSRFVREAEHRLRDVFPQRIRDLDELIHTKDFDLQEGLGQVRADSQKTIDVLQNDDRSDRNLPPQQVPGDALDANESLAAFYKILRPLALQLLEDAEVMAMWIQVNIPKIEDGNNFGVSVQEEVLLESTKIAADASTMLDFFTDYAILRGKLSSKAIKWPRVKDYPKALIDLDETTFVRIRLHMHDIRNYYFRLYDMFSKNVEKIRFPRNEADRQIDIMY